MKPFFFPGVEAAEWRSDGDIFVCVCEKDQPLFKLHSHVPPPPVHSSLHRFLMSGLIYLTAHKKNK